MNTNWRAWFRYWVVHQNQVFIKSVTTYLIDKTIVREFTYPFVPRKLKPRLDILAIMRLSHITDPNSVHCDFSRWWYMYITNLEKATSRYVTLITHRIIHRKFLRRAKGCTIQRDWNIVLLQSVAWKRT